jgi:hypothetical protein
MPYTFIFYLTILFSFASLPICLFVANFSPMVSAPIGLKGNVKDVNLLFDFLNKLIA